MREREARWKVVRRQGMSVKRICRRKGIKSSIPTTCICCCVMADLLIEEVSVLLNVIGQEVGLRANQNNIMAQ